MQTKPDEQLSIMNEASTTRLDLLRKAYEALYNESKAAVQKPKSDDPNHVRWNPDSGQNEQEKKLVESD